MLIDFVDAFINFEKPLIAGVNGPAIGIGVTTLALCDLVLASSNSTFQCPFTKIGQSPEGTSSYSMPAILGPSGASELLLRLGYKLNSKVGCVFSTVISSAFRVQQNRNDDHREDAPHFKDTGSN